MLQIKGLYNLLNEEQKKNFNRTVLGAGSDVVRETIELSRLVTNPDQQEIDETEKYMQNLYRAFAGVENVEMVKRGEREVAAIKEPESGALEFTRDIGAFVGSMVGVGKAAKPLQALGAVKKAQQVAPLTTKIGQTIATGEVAAQLSINPYEETLAGVIGSMIKENDGLEGDIKKYLLDPLTSSQEKTELENRLALLGEGLGLTGAVALTGKALQASSTPLLKVLNKIKGKGEQATTDFIDTMSGYKKLDTQQKKLALSKRKKDIAEGKVIGQGDVKALDSKLDQPINLQFSQSDLLRGLNDKARRLFTPQGGRTELMHEKFLKTENTKEKWNATINHVAGNLNRAIDEVVSKTGRDKEGLLEKINQVAFSDYKNIKTAKARQTMFESSLKSLPKEIQPFVRQMRETQDELSRLMTKTDYLTDEQKKLYQDNLGSYVRKSYRLYSQPGYTPDKSVAKEAKEYLKSEIRRNNSKLTDDEVILRAEAQYNDIIGNRKDAQNFNSSLVKFDKIRKEIFQGRKDIPTPVRNLLGEIDNPVEKFIHSATKLSSAVEDLKFHKEIFNDGKDIYFYSNKTGIFNKQIPQGFGKLSGQYTTPELQRYFTVGKDLGWNGADNWGGILWRNLTLLKGISQSAKTVWSHATHVKNITGGFQMSLANGTNPLDPKRISESLKVLKAKTKPGEVQEFYEELSGRGILNKGIVAGDLRGLVSDLEGVAPNNIFLKVLNSGINKKAQNLYIAEDDFFKINMYLGEQQYLKRLNNALPDGQRLSAEALKDEAARTVRDVLPNYDLVPEMLKDLRRTPVFGRFFSFMAESVRISVNSLTRGVREVNQGKQLIGNGNSKAGGIQLERGLRRLSSFTTVAGGGALALEKGSQALSGLSQEEVEAAKKFLPDYMQNSRIFVTVTPEGEPAIGNISSWDAYDFPKKPFQVLVNRALSDEKYTEESFFQDVSTTIISEMVSPFLGESIIQEQLSNYFLRGGRTLEGDLMVNPYDKTQRFEEGETYSEGLLNNLPILLSNIAKSIEPGTVSSISRYADTWDKEQTKFDQDIYKEESLIKFLTGFGVQPLNKEYLENVYSFKVSDFAKKKSMRRNNLYRAIEPDIKAEDFINQYLDQNQKYYREFSKLHRLTEAAEMFDLPIFELIKDSGFNRKDLATFIGKRRNFQPLGLTENLQLQILENSKSFDEFYDIVSDINEIDRQLSNLPVLIDDEIYKVMEEEESQPEQVFERLQKTVGGIVSGPEVPYTQEDPADRINPLTGEPYQEQMSRLGFAEGRPNRATRNNNPFNLVYGPAIGTKDIPWEGKVTHNPEVEDTFEVFENPVMGFRAGIKNTMTQFNRGNNTVEKLIKIHAPKKGDIIKDKDENPYQDNFINFTSKNLNVRPDEEINLNDPKVMKEYVRSVATFEGFETIKEEDITKALSLVEAAKFGGLGSSIEQQTQNN